MAEGGQPLVRLSYAGCWPLAFPFVEKMKPFYLTPGALYAVCLTPTATVGVKYYHFDSLYESESLVSLREVKK